MPFRIGIVGKGNVGLALGEGLGRSGHEIRFGTRSEDEPVRDATSWADVVILAVPWGALADVAEKIADTVEGKTVIDVTNVLTPSYELAIGFTISGAEELQKQLPEANVVKAFNTVFAKNMRTGQLFGQRLTVFIAGDSTESKEQVRKLAEDIGFDAVDAGPLKSARYLEPMGLLNINLGYTQQMGTDIGLRLVRQENS